MKRKSVYYSLENNQLYVRENDYTFGFNSVTGMHIHFTSQNLPKYLTDFIFVGYL